MLLQAYHLLFNSNSALLFFTLPIIAFFHAQNLAYIHIRLSSVSSVPLCLSQMDAEEGTLQSETPTCRLEFNTVNFLPFGYDSRMA